MTKQPDTANSMWGGRFDDRPDDVMTAINASIGIDKRLWRQDISGSKAHCAMLAAQGIIPQSDADKIIAGLDQVAQEIAAGTFAFRTDLEDIHMNIEHRLGEIIGDVAGKLHTARSRNDQVATDLRLWLRGACDDAVSQIIMLREALQNLADKHENDAMPGFTHLQTAQPITLGQHLDAYNQMLSRDAARLEDCRTRLNESPLGACALAGTGFPADRAQTAKALGFDRVMPNTMDAVSARDFVSEFLFATAQCGLHLSRLAEEIVLWSTPQFGFMTLNDRWSTGSSIMPQKKNPDAAELVRAKTGRLMGNLVQMMTVMKALPLAYNKDMQEDKAAVFESFDTLCLCLAAITGMLQTAEFHTEKMRAAAEDGYAAATEIADFLVRRLKMPFRKAHHVTGRIVKTAENNGVRLNQLSLEEMQAIEPGITADIFDALSLDGIIARRR